MFEQPCLIRLRERCSECDEGLTVIAAGLLTGRKTPVGLVPPLTSTCEQVLNQRRWRRLSRRQVAMMQRLCNSRARFSTICGG